MINVAKFVKKSFRTHFNYVVEHPQEFAISPTAFTRMCKWPIRKVLNAIFHFRGRSLANSLFDVLTKRELKRMTESKKTQNFSAAFIQQRDKLKPTAFEYIFSHVLGDCMKRLCNHTYHHYHIFAVDGSDFPMPSEVVPSKPDDHVQRKVQCSMLHLNVCYDPLNGIYLTYSIKPKLECSEREELVSLAQTIKQSYPSYHPEQTIMVTDRGYESYDTLVRLDELGFKYVCRAKSEKSNGILCGSGAFEKAPEGCCEVILEIPVRKDKSGKYRRCWARNWDAEKEAALTVRVVRKPSEQEGYIYFFTNLSQEEFPAEEISTIYEKRWDVETSFCHLKYRVDAIAFHAKKSAAQIMELIAAMIKFNCTSIILANTPVPQGNRKYEQKISFTEAFERCIRYILDDESFGGDLQSVLQKCLIPIRPHRKTTCKRNIRPTKKVFVFCYRP